MIEVKFLKKINFFYGLEQETLLAIAQRAYQRTITSGINIIIEGLEAESCYFILSGQLRVTRMNKEGRIQVLARLGPGAPINIISLLKEERINNASVESLTSVELLVLPANDFDYLMMTYPDFTTALLKVFAERMAKITNLAADLSLYTVRARLAQFLIELADQPQSAGGWTQDEIASQIGTVRDVVGRLLRDFEAQGLISRERQQVILLDEQGLKNEIEKSDY